MAFKSLVSVVTENIYKLTLAPTEHFEFSSFLILDENPCLVHAGKLSLFEPLLKLVKEKLGQKALSFIVFSHVEGDESGAVNEWLRAFGEAQVVCNKIANISLGDHLLRPAKIIKDTESISLGQKSLRMIETPHFPHNWDAHMWFEESSKVLFSSDFCCQGGFTKASKDVDQSKDIIDFYIEGGFIPFGKSTNEALDKLSEVDFKIIAPMHGDVLFEGRSRDTFEKVKSDLKSRS